MEEKQLDLLTSMVQAPTDEAMEWGRRVSRQQEAVADILFERERQDNTWGEQNHSPTAWFTILVEEVGEAAKAVLEKRLDHYRKEMVQVAAVALAMIECLDRNSGR